MAVACIGRIEIRICQPILKSESLACKFEIFLATLEDDVAIGVGIVFPALAFVGPTEHAAAFGVA